MAIDPKLEQQAQTTFGGTTAGQAGTNAFRAAYERLKAENLAKQSRIAQDYGSMYNQLRQQQYGQAQGAAQQAQGMGGGQAVTAQQALGARQMSALGAVQQGRQQALEGARAEQAGLYSNALLEGQQAADYAYNQQAKSYEREKQISDIADDTSISPEKKKLLLRALGLSEIEINARLPKFVSGGYRADLTTSGGTPSSFFNHITGN